MKGIKVELIWVFIKWFLYLLWFLRFNKFYFGLLKEVDVDLNIEDSKYGYEGKVR